MRVPSRRIAAMVAAPILILAAPDRSGASYILDSGTPSQSGNLSVFLDDGAIGQFLAQQFTLSIATRVTAIEAFLGGPSGAAVRMDLARAIGPDATADDLIASCILAAPGTFAHNGAWVASSLDAVLAAGTYFLVFSSSTSAGAFLPTSAPDPLGPSFFGPAVGLNPALPIASRFVPLNDATRSLGYFGVRIGGAVIPEPSSLLLCAVAGLAGLAAVGVRSRSRPLPTA